MGSASYAGKREAQPRTRLTADDTGCSLARVRLHQATWINRLAKRAAGSLSRLVCSPALLRSMRGLDAYLNFLMGKGSGVGWDLTHEIDAARAHIHRADPVVFDVGANVGEWTRQMLTAVPGATVYLFEPSETCRQEIARHGFARTEVVPYAVGESAGQAVLHVSSEFDHSASLHAREDSYNAANEYRAVTVEVLALDDFIEARGLPFVDFLKMDIEGHELFALRGARRSLESGKIGALSFEFGNANVNSHTFFRDFWQLLTTAGFQLWRITPGGRELLVEEYYEDYEYFRSVSNFVAERKRPAAA